MTDLAAAAAEGWDGEGDGREFQKGGDIYIYTHLWLIYVEV